MSFGLKMADEITRDEVLSLIQRVEDRRRVVWTAGRLLIEDGSLSLISSAPAKVRKSYFIRLRKILKSFEEEGVLLKRRVQFNYGTGTEEAYDFVGSNLQVRKRKSKG